jgi:hypothetical protein
MWMTHLAKKKAPLIRKSLKPTVEFTSKLVVSCGMWSSKPYFKNIAGFRLKAVALIVD